MALSFIKLNIDIIDDDKTKIIRSEESGDTNFFIWISLICYAMRSNDPGTLLLGEGIPHTIKTISKVISVDEKIIKNAFEIFENLNMIEKDDNGAWFLPNFEKHQNLDIIEKTKKKTRLRVKKYRERKKNNSKQSNEVVTRTEREYNGNVTESNALDKDIDKDKDKDKDIKVGDNFRKDAELIAKELLEHHKEERTGYFPITSEVQKFYEEVDVGEKLLRLGEDRDEVYHVLCWGMDDEFWSKNVSFRHYEKIRHKMEEKK